MHENDDIIIVDADGVVLDFFNQFFSFVKRIGYNVDLKNGHFLEDVCMVPSGDSIRSSSNGGQEAEEKVGSLIDVFFNSYSHANNMPAVKGAVEHLVQLRSKFKIICVTNIPKEFSDQRANNFDEVGLSFIDVINNSGSKKHVYEQISKSTSGVVINIDDMPVNVIDSIETSSNSSNGIVFSGGYSCHKWEDTYQSSRLAVAHTWEEVAQVANYYRDRHQVFTQCAIRLGVNRSLFIEKYKPLISYTEAIASKSSEEFIVRHISEIISKERNMLNLTNQTKTINRNR